MSAPDRSERIRTLFDEMVELEPGERAARLAEACGDDEELRREVESLLDAAEGAERGARRALEELRGVQGGGSRPEWAPGVIPAELQADLADRYAIEREIGRGGMATVYLAQDLKHNRKVALKVLRPALAAVVGAERFLAEIETTANLQHPHILPLYDSGKAESSLFYVMPFVEGETLRQRLDREKQLPVEESVRIATAVAGALDYAHRHGVVHRDVKPGNILMQDGEPVVGDFGIALAVGAAAGTRLTETGLIVGTPQYMSPEQASGDPAVGPATDTYALGCVLYEMLAGEPPHTGKTAHAVLARVLSSEPKPVTEHRRSVPAHLQAAIERALERVPADRFETPGAFADVLAGRVVIAGRSAAGAGSRRSSWLRRLLYAGGVVAVAALTWTAAKDGTRRPGPTYLSIALEPGLLVPQSESVQSIRLSSDGSMLLYRDSAGLRLRRLSSPTLEARPIPHTSDVLSFDVSPDNGRLALLSSDSTIRVQNAESDAVSTVVARGVSCCVTWSDDGDFIYFTNGDGGVSRVSPAGGGPTTLTTTDGGPAHVWPHPVPGTDLVVFELAGTYGVGSMIALLDLRSGEYRELVEGTNPTPLDDLILFSTITGELRVTNRRSEHPLAVTIATGLAGGGGGGLRSAYDVSSTGDLVYVTGNEGPGRAPYGTPVWVGRDGTETPIDSTVVRPFRRIRLAPDGSRLALSTLEGGGTARVYVWDLRGGPLNPITPQGKLRFHPSWAPNGQVVHYTAQDVSTGSEPRLRVVRARYDGAGEPEPVGLPEAASAMMTADGRWWIYRTRNTAPDGGNLMALRADLGSEPVPLAVTSAREAQPSVSRDGRWFAYSSDREGLRQVYVRPFPNADDGLVPVTRGGGESPMFSPASDELFVVEDGWMVAMTYTTQPTFRITGRRRLFQTSPYATGGPDSSHDYDMTADGQTFLMIRRSGLPGNVRRVVLVLDDGAELKAAAGRN